MLLKCSLTYYNVKIRPKSVNFCVLQPKMKMIFTRDNLILASLFVIAAPPLISPSKRMPVLLGDYLTLTCSTESLNDTVDWFHNDTILSTTTTRMLILPAVLSHNLGLYTCRSRSDNTTSDPFQVYSKGNEYSSQNIVS